MDIGALLFLFSELVILLRLWCCTENSMNLMHCRVVSLVVLSYGNTPIISPLGAIGFVRWGAGELPSVQKSSAGTTSRGVLPSVGMSQDLL